MGNNLRRYGIWVVVALVGAVCWGVLALSRGETINAGWLLFAAIASYAIAYRFYARFIQTRVLEADDSRATPAERLNNGRDFEPMDRRVLFGHHFAAIAGAGPLVGPVLAAQMGFLPGTVWIIVGVILAGAVQDMTTLFFSMRRDAAHRAYLLARHLPQRFAVSSHGEEERRHVLHSAGQDDADDDPDRPRQKAHLGREHRSDERTRPGNGGEVVSEEHPPVHRLEVAAVV